MDIHIYNVYMREVKGQTLSKSGKQCWPTKEGAVARVCEKKKKKEEEAREKRSECRMNRK